MAEVRDASVAPFEDAKTAELPDHREYYIHSMKAISGSDSRFYAVPRRSNWAIARDSDYRAEAEAAMKKAVAATCTIGSTVHLTPCRLKRLLPLFSLEA